MASSIASTSRHTLSSTGKISLRGLHTSNLQNVEGGRRTSAQAASSSQRAFAQAGADEAFLTQRKNRALRSKVLDTFADLGSTQTKATSFRPHKPRLNPIEARELTVSHLLASTAHVGHSISSLSRGSIPFLHGTRHGQAIIDVEKYTLPALKQACKIVKDVVYRDGVVIFLGTAPGTERCLLQAAKRLGPHGFHITKERWIPGLLTNASKMLTLAVLGDMNKYEEQFQNQKGYYAEVDATALATQHLLPDLIIIFNPKENAYAIREATAKGIPTIGVIDTDVDPRIVTYAIPANDESIRTTELIAGLLSKAGEEGVLQRQLKLDELDKKRRREYAIRKRREAEERNSQDDDVDE